MKNPLLWVVILFASGEALCRYAAGSAGLLPVAGFLGLIMLLIVAFIRRNTNMFVFRLLFAAFLTGLLMGFYVEQKKGAQVFKDGFTEGSRCTIEGSVLSVSEQETGGKILIRQNGIKVMVYVEPLKPDDPIYPGQKLEVYGRLMHFEEAENPGQFNARQYYESQGIYYQMAAERITVTDRNRNEVKTFLMKLKDALSESIDCLFPAKEASVVKSILLGDKAEMDGEIKALYQENGIAHILAISGLHTALLGVFLAGLLRKFGLGQKKAEGTAFLCLVLYGIMTGFSPSAMRAVLMIGITWLGGWLKRTPYPPASMAAALFLMLLIRPEGIYNIGMQMSFLAVCGVDMGNRIILMIHSKRKKKGKWKSGKRLLEKVLSGLVLSFSINLYMMPVQIYYFYELPLYSMLLNLLVIPLFTIAAAAGFLAALSGLLLPYFSGVLFSGFFFVGKCLAFPCTWILKFYEALCRLFLHFPFHRILPGHCRLFQIAIYFLLLQSLFCLIQKHKCADLKKAVSFLAAGLALIILFLGSTYRLNQKEFHAVFLSVGQGDGCIIHTPEGINIMVDGGSSGSDSVGKYVLSPALKYYGMARLDYVFVSHTDSDHVSGILYLLEEQDMTDIKIKYLVFAKGIERTENYERLLDAAEKYDTHILYVSAGDTFESERLKMEVLHPSLENAGLDANDYSLVLNMRYRNLDILFTGDISASVEKNLVGDAERIASSDASYIILKAAHHGSRYSSDMEFLQALSADLAVISCGKYNTYGHPHPETLERLKESGSDIFRTDMEGALCISGRKGRILVRKEL